MKTNLIRNIKRTTIASSMLLGILFSSASSQAITVDEVPNPRATYGGWVSDTADILSDSTEAQLNKMISELEAKNGAEISVVTVNETSPYPSPKAFTTKLFNHWGIGKKNVNNGVLYLVSVGDRRVEIETGYGLTKILPDSQVQNIIDNQIIPNYKQGNFDRGTLAGTKAIVAVLAEATVENSQYQAQPRNNIFEFILVFILVLGTFGLFFIVMIRSDCGAGGNSRRGRSSGGGGYIGNGGSIGGGYIGSGGSSGGGFGGGSSGGGGAGGSF